MRDFILTSDNLHLSQVKNGALEGRVEEGPTVNCTNILSLQDQAQNLTEAAADLLRHSLAANTDLPLQALLMAVWRRKPKAKVHSPSRGLKANRGRAADQGSQ